MAGQRVIVADRNCLFRAALCTLLTRILDLWVVGSVSTGEEVLQLVTKTEIDLLFLDLELPGLGGWEVLRLTQEARHPPRVILLSTYEDPAFDSVARAHGASAYAVKGDVHTMLTVVRTLLDE